MTIEVITSFIARATVRIIAYIYDDTGALVDPVDPGSVQVTIYNPDGTQQLLDTPSFEADMTAMDDPDNGDFVGIYEYYYRTDADTAKGWWRGEVIVIDGTDPNDRTSIEAFGFEVVS